MNPMSRGRGDKGKGVGSGWRLSLCHRRFLSGVDEQRDTGGFFGRLQWEVARIPDPHPSMRPIAERRADVADRLLILRALGLFVWLIGQQFTSDTW